MISNRPGSWPLLGQILRAFGLYAVTVITVMTVAGCGVVSTSSEAGISANLTKDEGMAALVRKDWKAADELLTKALSAKFLGGDQYEEAVLGRVRARIELGEYAAATEDLTPLEFQAAAMDQVWMLKCDLALRQGNMVIAQHAYEEGRKMNPKLPKPEGLK